MNSQRSLTDQMRDLVEAASKLGLYDAQDWLQECFFKKGGRPERIEGDGEIFRRQIATFWSRVNKSPGQGPNGDCWEWAAGKKNKKLGYGGFFLEQRKNTVSAHKLSFLFSHNFGLDDLPEGIVVRHTCNNPPCVRPEHLTLGTRKDNSQDMVKAGRSYHGVQNNKAKLDPEKVREIRSLWATGQYSQVKIAKMYDIWPGTVHQVVNNLTWKDPSYDPAKVEGFKAYKISPETVHDLKRRVADGESILSLAKELGISNSQAYNIIRGRQRKGEVE